MTKVGIFWGVPDDTNAAGNHFTLVIDSTASADAEPYGLFLTHPRGHYEVWEHWRKLGPGGLAKRGLPKMIAWIEYEEFPRGRIVFDTQGKTFIIYADRRLQGAAQIQAIRSTFCLEQAATIIRTDTHYKT